MHSFTNQEHITHNFAMKIFFLSHQQYAKCTASQREDKYDYSESEARLQSHKHA